MLLNDMAAQMHIRAPLFALASSILIPTAPASAATIGFDDLLTPSAFTTYAESGFTVSAAAGDWAVRTNYGNPEPFIYFVNPTGQLTNSAQIEVTAGGELFTFESVDLYSSVTPIPFLFVGFLNSDAVLNQSGTVPNTFGRFATVTGNLSPLIDTLRITLFNPATPQCPNCGGNPVGLDNIVLNAVPEPSTALLLGIGLAAAARRRMQRS